MDQREIGVAAAGDGASVEMADSVVDGTRASDGNTYGHGVVGASGVVALQRCRIANNDAAGLAFVDTRAAVAGAVVTKNGIGIFVDETSALSEASSASLPESPATVVVDSSTVFVDNATRVSGGSVPVPRILD